MKRFLKQNSGFLVLLLCFGIFRTAIADWNTIPSGSMRPTILEGDVVLVNRVAYDLKVPLTDIALARLGEPKRGDVITFTSPADGVRLIKRLVALPGDVVEMQHEQVLVNGVAAQYDTPTQVVERKENGGTTIGLRTTERSTGKDHAVQFLPDQPAQRSFGPYVIPADHYFFLGDNRDASNDSRYIGPVPRKLLIGRAHHIVVSADILGDWMPRFARTGEKIQ
jgi:signal peptidase I